MNKFSTLAVFTALTSAASAAYTFNEYISAEGYAVGSYVVTDPAHADPDSTFLKGEPMTDSVYLALNGKYKDFTAKVSAVFLPGKWEQNYDSAAGIRDAYLTYTAGSVAITGGKFNTVLGYESTDPIYNYFPDYSSSYYDGGYHTGVKADYTGDGFSAGFAAVDSVNTEGLATSFYQGDGEFGEDIGYEAYVSFTGVKDLTVWTGVGIENVDDATDVFSSVTWASYNVTDKLTVAGEFTYMDEVTNYSWQALANYAFTGHVSAAVRVSGADYCDGTADEVKYSFAPTYTINDYASLRAGVSFTDRSDNTREILYVAQALLKF